LGITLRHEILSLLSYKLLKFEKKHVGNDNKKLVSELTSTKNKNQNQNIDKCIEALVDKTANMTLSSFGNNNEIDSGECSQHHRALTGTFEYYKELFSFQNESAKKFQEEYIDILPEDWIVCMLTITSDYKHFLVIRLQRETLPIAIKIDATQCLTKPVLKHTNATVSTECSQKRQENETQRKKMPKASKRESKCM
jgi:hypothetical protein